MPLHKPKCVAMYHQQLAYCVTQVRHLSWPRMNTPACCAAAHIRIHALCSLHWLSPPPPHPPPFYLSSPAVCGEGPQAGGRRHQGPPQVLALDQQPKRGAVPVRAGGAARAHPGSGVLQSYGSALPADRQMPEQLPFPGELVARTRRISLRALGSACSELECGPVHGVARCACSSSKLLDTRPRFLVIYHQPALDTHTIGLRWEGSCQMAHPTT